MGCGVSTQEGGIASQETNNNGRTNQKAYDQGESSPAADQEAADRFASSGKSPASPLGTTDSIDNGAPQSPHFSDRSHLSEKEQEQIKDISARRRKQKTLSTNPESLDHYRNQTGKIEDDDEYYPKRVELSESTSEREGTQSINSMDMAFSLGTSTSSVGLNGSIGMSKSALKKRNSQWGTQSARGSISNGGGADAPISPQHQQQPEYLADPMECFIDGNVNEKDLALLFPIRINNTSTSSHVASPPLLPHKGLTESTSFSIGGLTGSQMLPPRLGEEDPDEDELIDDLEGSGSMRKSVRFSIHTLNGSN